MLTYPGTAHPAAAWWIIKMPRPWNGTLRGGLQNYYKISGGFRPSKPSWNFKIKYITHSVFKYCECRILTHWWLVIFQTIPDGLCTYNGRYSESSLAIVTFFVFAHSYTVSDHNNVVRTHNEFESLCFFRPPEILRFQKTNHNSNRCVLSYCNRRRFFRTIFSGVGGRIYITSRKVNFFYN